MRLICIVFCLIGILPVLSSNVFAQNVPTVELWRLYCPSMQEHFYTKDPVERQNLIDRKICNDEGIVGYVFPSYVDGTIEFYRVYLATNRHLYTTSTSELGNLCIGNFTRGDCSQEFGKVEGNAGYVYSSHVSGTTALYRVYIPATEDNFYTADSDEYKKTLNSMHAQDKGIAAYLYKSPQTYTPPPTGKVIPEFGPLAGIVIPCLLWLQY